MPPPPPPCFVSGSKIAAPDGLVSVEDIRVGRLLTVVAASGDRVRKVIWVGSKTIELSPTPGGDLAAPIIIRSGAMADCVPDRDMRISPDHRIFIGGRLVPARLLVNGMTVLRDLAPQRVTYHHIELERHAVLLADNLPVESFLDEQNDRSFFASDSGVAAMRPVLPNLHDPDTSQRACAPLAMTPAASREAWQTLYDRAIALGYAQPVLATSDAPELHLLADSLKVRPFHHTATEASFVLPTTPSSLRLVSRASSPSELDRDANDWRILGVAVREIVYRSAEGETVFLPDHPAFVEGWQDMESDGVLTWRWTGGNARLPLPCGPVTLTVRFFAQPAYLLADSVALSRAA